MQDEKKWEGWAIVNLMGHHTKSGYLSEQNIAGTPFIRLDIKWRGIDKTTTEFYAPGAIHSIIPCDEETALAASSTEQTGIGLYTARQLIATYDELREKLQKLEGGDGERMQLPKFGDEGDDIPY